MTEKVTQITKAEKMTTQQLAVLSFKGALEIIRSGKKNEPTVQSPSIFRVDGKIYSLVHDLRYYLKDDGSQKETVEQDLKDFDGIAIKWNSLDRNFHLRTLNMNCYDTVANWFKSLNGYCNIKDISVLQKSLNNIRELVHKEKKSYLKALLPSIIIVDEPNLKDEAQKENLRKGAIQRANNIIGVANE